MAARNWVFTLNNPDADDFIRIKNAGKGVAMQIEKGGEGTIHIQGYVEFSNNTTLAIARRAISQRAHLEKRKGSRSQAIEYSLKVDTRFGESYCNLPRRGQGQRMDLQEVHEALRAGMSYAECSDKFFYPWLKYRRGFSEYLFIHANKQWRSVEVIVYLGKTGIGKTRLAWQLYPDLFRLPTPGKDYNTLWFNGYYGQDTMLIDDMRRGYLRYSDLIAIIDGHPIPCETKGGFVFLNVTRIIITTNVHPDHWYDYDYNMEYDILKRRITEIKEIF